MGIISTNQVEELSEFEFGWLVGILEGEGCFDLHKKNPNQKGTQRIKVMMNDEDTIHRVRDLFYRLTGKQASIYRQTYEKENWEDSYQITLSGKDAALVMRMVVKHMSIRRRQKIWQCLNFYRVQYKKMDIANIVKLVRERQ